MTSGTFFNPTGVFGSGTLTTGQEYSYTFNDAGAYDYFCSQHPASMKGTIKVVAPYEAAVLDRTWMCRTCQLSTFSGSTTCQRWNTG